MDINPAPVLVSEVIITAARVESPEIKERERYYKK